MQGERNIPTGYEKVFDDGDVIVYSQNIGGRIYGIAYVGKAKRSTWHFSFRSAEALQEKINGLVAGRKAHADIVAKRKAEVLDRDGYRRQEHRGSAADRRGEPLDHEQHVGDRGSGTQQHDRRPQALPRAVRHQRQGAPIRGRVSVDWSAGVLERVRVSEDTMKTTTFNQYRIARAKAKYHADECPAWDYESDDGCTECAELDRKVRVLGRKLRAEASSP